jgi:hypothetical protein
MYHRAEESKGAEISPRGEEEFIPALPREKKLLFIFTPPPLPASGRGGLALGRFFI